MAEVLKHALKNLCTRTGWCYAVFWKLKRRSRMVLTWEDGHYEPLQASNPLEGSGTVYRQMEHQINLAVVKMSFHVYSLGEGIIGRVAFTGKHQWIYGNQRLAEIGQAAGSSEKYPDGWSNQFAAGINTIAVVAVPQGVVQLGSVQVMPEDLNMVGQIRALFGTLQSVPGAFVSDLTSDARLSRSTVTPAPSTTKAYAPAVHQNRSFAVPFSGFSKTLEYLPHDPGPSVYFNNTQPQQSQQQQLSVYPGLDQKAVFHQTAAAVRVGYDSIRVPSDLAVKRPKLANHHLSTDFHSGQNHNLMGTGSSSLEARNPTPPSTTNLTSTKLFSPLDIPGPDSFRHNNSDNRQFGTNNSNIWSPSSQGSSFPGFESLPQLGEETTTTTTCLLDSDEGYDYNSLFKALQKDDLEDFNGVLAALSKDCGMLPAAATTNETATTSAAAASSFAFGDELSEVLALLQKNEPVGSNLNVLVSPPPADVKPVDTKLPAFELPSTDEKLPGYSDILAGLGDNKMESLLDAVVAGASMSSSPCSKQAAKESPKPAAAFTGSSFCDGSLQPAPPVTTTSCSKELLGKVPEKTAQQAVSSPLERVGVAKWSSSALQMKAAASSWTSEGSHHATSSSKKASAEHSSSKDNSGASKKQEDANTRVIGRKRLRPGETPRPRPKDRQQIQDRVRELRDIVPNATKCSIDSLLEKTIKHMQFLQSVTQHGDKWKAGADTKVESMYDQQQQQQQQHCSTESGATWAMEVGPKGPSPVSVVENLRQPGQMLVEMLCEEKGLFWEIADKIRGLGLTILKGVMESRNDKVWARFNVEMQASCGVNRCKVLWNLVQLLEPNSNKHNGGGGGATAGGGGGAITGAAAVAGSAVAAGAASFTGSEVTDVCSESFSGFHTPTLAAHRGITVSSNGW